MLKHRRRSTQMKEERSIDNCEEEKETEHTHIHWCLLKGRRRKLD